MKVSKTVSVDLELLLRVLKMEKNFSKAVSEALVIWLERIEDKEKKDVTVKL